MNVSALNFYEILGMIRQMSRLGAVTKVLMLLLIKMDIIWNTRCKLSKSVIDGALFKQCEAIVSGVRTLDTTEDYLYFLGVNEGNGFAYIKITL